MDENGNILAHLDNEKGRDQNFVQNMQIHIMSVFFHVIKLKLKLFTETG